MKHMLSRDSCIRITTLVLSLAIIGALVYPYIMEEAAENGYSNILQFYVRAMVETIRDYKFNWAIVQYGITISFLGFGIEMLILGWSRSSLRRLIKFEDKSSINDWGRAYLCFEHQLNND